MDSTLWIFIYACMYVRMNGVTVLCCPHRIELTSSTFCTTDKDLVCVYIIEIALLQHACGDYHCHPSCPPSLHTTYLLLSLRSTPLPSSSCFCHNYCSPLLCQMTSPYHSLTCEFKGDIGSGRNFDGSITYSGDQIIHDSLPLKCSVYWNFAFLRTVVIVNIFCDDYGFYTIFGVLLECLS